MRPSLLPGLLAALGRNIDRGTGDLALFEVGPQYAGDAPDDQTLMVTGIRSGAVEGDGSARHWTGGAKQADAFDAKADAIAVLEACGAPVQNLQVVAEAPDYYHPGRSGTIRLGPKNILATFGELHPRVLEAMGRDTSNAFLKLSEDGKITVITGLPDMGQSSHTAMAIIAAEALGVEAEDVTVVSGDTDVTPYDVGAFSQRGTFMTLVIPDKERSERDPESRREASGRAIQMHFLFAWSANAGFRLEPVPDCDPGPE